MKSTNAKPTGCRNAICWNCQKSSFWNGCCWLQSYTVPANSLYITSKMSNPEVALSDIPMKVSSKFRVIILRCPQFVAEQSYLEIQQQEAVKALKESSRKKSSRKKSSRKKSSGKRSSSYKRPYKIEKPRKLGKRKPNSRVLKVDLLYNRVIKEYENASQAAAYSNMSPNPIYKCLSYQQSTADGYRWCYKGEQTAPLQIIIQFDEKGKEIRRFKNLAAAAKYFNVSSPTMNRMFASHKEFQSASIVFDDTGDCPVEHLEMLPKF